MLRVLVVFTLALVLGCSSDDAENPLNQSAPPPTGNNGNPVSPLPLSCTLSLPNNGAAVASGSSVAITLTGSGGNAPYATSGFSGTFPSTATLSRTYTNSGSTNQIVTENVTISDAAGKTASCSVAVTVLPPGGGSGGNNLRCSIALNPSVIRTGTVAEMVGTVAGGTAPYQFVSFDMGGALVTEPMLPLSMTQVRTKGTYSSPGLKTATLTVKDADLNQYACYISFTVLSPPSVTLSAAPSTTVETGQYVTLSATTVGFTAQPTLVFSTTETNINIINAGGGAYVVSTDKAVHSFDVKVVATSGNESAETTIHLNFTTYVPLQCTLTRTGTLKTGEEIEFKITANNGEPLQLTEFSQGSAGSVLSYTSNSAKVKYYNPGTKTVTAKAMSTTSGKECQNGAGLSQSFTIANALTCSVNLGSTWVPRATYAFASAVIPVSAPFAPFSLHSVTVSPNINWGYYGSYGDTGAVLAYFSTGAYTVTLKVQDIYGNQATCSAVQQVY